jgi:hypothetical protein
MTVRDAAGNRLGKVRRVYAWGFEVSRRFWSPYQWVLRHDEVSRVTDDGVVEVARSPQDLVELAQGGLPASWRRYTPPSRGTPIAGPPLEASATERLVSSPPRAEAGGEVEPDDVRESVRTRRQPGADAAAHS